MDVLIPVIKNRTFPVIHQRLEKDISSMLSFQYEKKEGLKGALLDEKITDKYIASLAPRWDTIGANSAQIVSENMVQSSLSSHRMAGVSKAASGFTRIKEITDLSNRTNIVNVITTPTRGIPRNRIQINELANVIVGLTLDSLVTRIEIVGEKPSWYPVFIKMFGIPSSLVRNRFLRLYLDEYKMYKHRISMNTIYNILDSNISASTGLTFLYPPASLVDQLYIDVHDGKINESEIPIKRDFPLYDYVPTLRAQIIGGIPSVTSAEPIGVNLLKDLQVIQVGDTYEVRSKVSDFVHPSAWSHLLTMLVPNVEILSPSGRVFRPRDEKYRNVDLLTKIILQIPTTYEGIANPPQILEDNRVLVTFRREMRDEFPFLRHVVMEDRVFESKEEAESFLLLSIAEFITYWYIEAVTDTAQDLYAITEVDNTRTYTTSPYNLKDTIGYMAMRSMIYQEFRANISVVIDPIKTIINKMTLYTDPVAFTRQSLENDRTEFLTYATFEDILAYIMGAAFAGETDNMLSVSSKILTGQMVDIGKGGDRMYKENGYIAMRREKKASK